MYIYKYVHISTFICIHTYECNHTKYTYTIEYLRGSPHRQGLSPYPPSSGDEWQTRGRLARCRKRAHVSAIDLRIVGISPTDWRIPVCVNNICVYTYE